MKASELCIGKRVVVTHMSSVSRGACGVIKAIKQHIDRPSSALVRLDDGRTKTFSCGSLTPEHVQSRVAEVEYTVGMSLYVKRDGVKATGILGRPIGLRMIITRISEYQVHYRADKYDPLYDETPPAGVNGSMLPVHVPKYFSTTPLNKLSDAE